VAVIANYGDDRLAVAVWGVWGLEGEDVRAFLLFGEVRGEFNFSEHALDPRRITVTITSDAGQDLFNVDCRMSGNRPKTSDWFFGSGDLD
jgi:hypothetical protein